MARRLKTLRGARGPLNQGGRRPSTGQSSNTCCADATRPPTGRCGTVQVVDLNMPGSSRRLLYRRATRTRVTPVMLHRAHVRLARSASSAFSIEHHGGPSGPLWLSPLQAVVANHHRRRRCFNGARCHPPPRGRAGGCGSRPTCGTRKSITRCASNRSRKGCRRCLWSARKEGQLTRTVSIRRLGTRGGRPCWLLDAALKVASPARPLPPDVAAVEAGPP